MYYKHVDGMIADEVGMTHKIIQTAYEWMNEWFMFISLADVDGMLDNKCCYQLILFVDSVIHDVDDMFINEMKYCCRLIL